MKRPCQRCGKVFEAQRSSAKWCSSSCSAKASQDPAGNQPKPVVSGSGRTFAAVLAQLEQAERVGSPRGAMALALAQRVDETPGSGAASLVKELRVTLDEALEGALTVADAMDELTARRDRKRNAG